MRIAYVSPRYAPFVGGVETHVAQLAQRAATEGHHVEVLTQEADRRLPALQVLQGVTVRRFAVPLPSQNYAFAPGLWAYLARTRRQYDVVHAHSYHALPSLGAAVAGCRPLVFTPHYHGTGHSPLRRLLHMPYRLAGASIFRRASRVICVSHAEAALVRQHFPQTALRVAVIPNGVDVAALREAQPYHEAGTTILSVGRLEEYKNVHLTIAALAHLDDTFVLRVAGDGPARPGLEELVARLGLQGRVRFLGRVSDMELRRWFRSAGVYISMSSHEAFGITLYEALAAGSRVVAADIPAYREVGAGQEGVTLVPLDLTPQGLAQAILCVAAREQGCAPASDVPSWDAVARQTLRMYQTVAGISIGS